MTQLPSGDILQRIGQMASPLPDVKSTAVKALTLLNGWVNYGSPYPDAGYYMTPDGMVHLTGLIKSGTTTAFTAVGNLPAGFRPVNFHLFPAVGGAGFCSFDVRPFGDVVIASGGSAAWMSLDGIRFRAYQ